MAAPSKGNPPADWPERFLAEYSKTGNVSHSARKAQVDRSTVYDRRDSNPEFAGAMEDAKEAANALLELEAIRRATRGTLRPVFYKGSQCGSVREYSDALLAVLLKANMPDKYKERISNEHTGKDGAPIAVSISDAIDKVYGLSGQSEEPIGATEQIEPVESID